MRNTIGNNLTLTLFGESHGDKIGATLDGIAPGILIDEDFLKSELSKRRPSLSGETNRVENDEYQFISGVFNGYTTGAPLTILISNHNIRSKDYEAMKNTPRPSHADYVAHIKYDGFEDYRGGGHFSGRVTAPIVALGSILMNSLKKKGIYVFSHIQELGGVKDVDFIGKTQFSQKEIQQCMNSPFPVVEDCSSLMEEKMKEVADKGDSIGGLVQTAVLGLPAGMGEPFFSSLESEISKAIFSIGGIKGISFGLGFGFKDNLGSQVNDAFEMKDGNVVTKTNYNGGVNGGISNGMPIVFSSVVKPTPSIAMSQDTVNMEEKQNAVLVIRGRHDPCIVRRVVPVINALTAFVMADMLTLQYGRDYLKDGQI